MKTRLTAAALLSLFLATPIWAQLVPPSGKSAELEAATAPQEQRAVTVSLTQKKVVKDGGGRDKLIDADAVKPNDVLEYRVVYKNVSSQTVRGIAANLPLPEGLEYVARSAQPEKGAQFALQADGAFAPEPLMRKGSDGRMQAVPYDEYRQIRWRIDELAPGAQAVVSARATVEAVKPKTAPSASTSPNSATTRTATATAASPTKP
ncbi:putative repeat protein (TIGR01451 family) [Pseudacidovorax intermedius]|uniref:Putative repeat protein (TIGR01451 family) n=1 Tax=Pseudacidovorax intermedius TaxID=433924 RepID=A0A370FHP7_9BURK|nr:DUF11 domain-containing protein [Pseudacidovorax intermedius]RDI25851.1 putative repeat protein (TIGR01451 family) [Pseudacidovorax intermedius]